jgi:5-methylthioadenosine/S-adenosylhomocysteine deaminase
MEQADLIITNGMILTMDADDTFIERGAVAVRNGKIIMTGPSEQVEAAFQSTMTVDAEGMAVLPGFVNTHFHCSQNFMKGTRDDYDLLDWIDKVSFPRIKVTMDQYRKGQGEIHRLAVLHSGIDLLSSGVTCTTNMEWGMNPSILEAYNRIGARFVNILTLTDVDTWTPPEAIIPTEELFALGADLHRTFQEEGQGRTSFAFGIACPNSVTEEMILRARKEATALGCRLHIHLAETEFEYKRFLKERQLSPTAYLEGLGFWDRDVWAAHSIWLDDKDIEILARRGVGVAHNPKCNMKIADGAAPISDMLKAGVPVGLGIDSCAVSDNTDFFEAMRTMVFLQRLRTMDPKAVLGRQALRMATIEGARVLGMEDEIGSLEKGKAADMVLIDLSGVNLRPYNDLVNNLVFAANSSNIDRVIVGGETLVSRGQFVRFDRDAELEEVEHRAGEIYRKAGISLPPWFCINDFTGGKTYENGTVG